MVDLPRGNREAVVLLMTLATIAGGRLPSEAQKTSISGVIRNSAGEPVAGALVKIRSDELGLGFLVVSQTQGRYSSPGLLAGKYMVQGFGGTHQSTTAGPVEVSSGQEGKMDPNLSTPLRIPPREKRMTNQDYEKLLPAGPAKSIVAGQCGVCHSLEWVLSARKTRKQWEESYYRMFDHMYDLRKLFIYHQALKDEEDEVVLEYLAKHFGPDTPLDPRVVNQWFLRPGGPSHSNRNLPTTLLQGAAAKYVGMEFSLPAGSMPRDIAVDSQGIAWVTERKGGVLGRFDANSLTYTRIAPPAGKNPKIQLNAVAVDPQDHIWFVDDGPNTRILQYNPKGGEFNTYLMPEYPFPAPESGWGRVTTLGFLNGSVWATGTTSSRILRLDPTSRKIVDYSIPSGSLPFGLAAGRGNMIWYTAFIPSQLVKLDPDTGRLEKYYPPDIQENERADLRGVAVDAEGNVWLAAAEKGLLLKLDYRTSRFAEYPIPTEDSGPFAVDVDTKRNLIWFSEIYSDRMGRFDPRTNTFVEFPHPNSDSDVRRIEVDRSRPNRVWWSSPRNGKIGYVEVTE